MAPHAALAPMFTVLRIGLHALFLGLAAFAAIASFLRGGHAGAWGGDLAILLIVVYLAGAIGARRMRARQDRSAGSAGLAGAAGLAGSSRAAATAAPAAPGAAAAAPAAGPGIRGVIWVLTLTALWAGLVWLAPEGAYIVFPLFFLFLHLIPGPLGYVAIVLSTGLAILGLGTHLGFGFGVIVGPLLGAGVAILIGLGYRALVREAREREELLSELLTTRERLAETERERGAIAERARLAREIHDTVAQGLSSIQMLLHAAERDAGPAGAGVRHIRLARETAAESLAETRGLIRELAPPALDEGLPSALRRLAEEQERRTGIEFIVEAPDRTELPMDVQSALLRIAQGAVSNAVRHASPNRVRIALAEAEGPGEAAAGAARSGSATLTVQDDGTGFDPLRAAEHSGAGESFGLRAIAERVEQLDGVLDVHSHPGRGTELVVRIGEHRPAPLTAEGEER
ncbi:sensor histidine kinase [Leucobacter sp. CSA2]|uniref:Sensor histidine kinase n=1 Tax=Leucobacter edaphi TaxID=2796472 RepID=A0A934QC21_9MICO|nr:sensor histidine kinase [Leucobacter edaphi]MBK0420991.1 sensor histidine kinase [Leucobacter edaphi]